MKSRLLLTTALVLTLAGQTEIHAATSGQPTVSAKSQTQFVVSPKTKQAIIALLSGKTDHFDGPIQTVEAYVRNLSDDDILALAQQNPELPQLLKRLGLIELAEFVSGILIQTQFISNAPALAESFPPLSPEEFQLSTTDDSSTESRFIQRDTPSSGKETTPFPPMMIGSAPATVVKSSPKSGPAKPVETKATDPNPFDALARDISKGVETVSNAAQKVIDAKIAGYKKQFQDAQNLFNKIAEQNREKMAAAEAKRLEAEINALTLEKAAEAKKQAAETLKKNQETLAAARKTQEDAIRQAADLAEQKKTLNADLKAEKTKAQEKIQTALKEFKTTEAQGNQIAQNLDKAKQDLIQIENQGIDLKLQLEQANEAADKATGAEKQKALAEVKKLEHNLDVLTKNHENAEKAYINQNQAFQNYQKTLEVKADQVETADEKADETLAVRQAELAKLNASLQKTKKEQIAAEVSIKKETREIEKTSQAIEKLNQKLAAETEKEQKRLAKDQALAEKLAAAKTATNKIAEKLQDTANNIAQGIETTKEAAKKIANNVVENLDATKNSVTTTLEQARLAAQKAWNQEVERLTALEKARQIEAERERLNALARDISKGVETVSNAAQKAIDTKIAGYKKQLQDAQDLFNKTVEQGRKKTDAHLAEAEKAKKAKEEARLVAQKTLESLKNQQTITIKAKDNLQQQKVSTLDSNTALEKERHQINEKLKTAQQLLSTKGQEIANAQKEIEKSAVKDDAQIKKQLSARLATRQDDMEKSQKALATYKKDVLRKFNDIHGLAENWFNAPEAEQDLETQNPTAYKTWINEHKPKINAHNENIEIAKAEINDLRIAIVDPEKLNEYAEQLKQVSKGFEESKRDLELEEQTLKDEVEKAKQRVDAINNQINENTKKTAEIEEEIQKLDKEAGLLKDQEEALNKEIKIGESEDAKDSRNKPAETKPVAEIKPVNLDTDELDPALAEPDEDSGGSGTGKGHGYGFGGSSTPETPESIADALPTALGRESYSDEDVNVGHPGDYSRDVAIDQDNHGSNGYDREASDTQDVGRRAVYDGNADSRGANKGGSTTDHGGGRQSSGPAASGGGQPATGGGRSGGGGNNSSPSSSGPSSSAGGSSSSGGGASAPSSNGPSAGGAGASAGSAGGAGPASPAAGASK